MVERPGVIRRVGGLVLVAEGSAAAEVTAAEEVTAVAGAIDRVLFEFVFPVVAKRKS